MGGWIGDWFGEDGCVASERYGLIKTESSQVVHRELISVW